MIRIRLTLNRETVEDSAYGHTRQIVPNRIREIVVDVSESELDRIRETKHFKTGILNLSVADIDVLNIISKNHSDSVKNS